MVDGYFDIHCHTLYSVDDGPATFEQTFEMLDKAYADGIRSICFTPHYQPPIYTKTDKVKDVFDLVKKHAEEKYPDLNLYLGNEIFYHNDCVDNLKNGACMTLGATNYVLVEFGPGCDYGYLKFGLTSLLSCGYRPILAHVERYMCLLKNKKHIDELFDLGVLFQGNADVLTKKSIFELRSFLKYMIKHRYLHFVATDAHGLTSKKQILSESYAYVERKYGTECACELFLENQIKIFSI